MKKEVLWANDNHNVNHMCNQAISMLVLGIQQPKAGWVRNINDNSNQNYDKYRWVSNILKTYNLTKQ